MIHKDANGRDPRYDLIPALYKDGRINTFADIFIYIPKTTTALDAHIGPTRFNRLMADPGEATIKEIGRIAALVGLERVQMFELMAKTSG